MISKAPVSFFLFLPLSLPSNSLLFSISAFPFSFPTSPHLFFLISTLLLFLYENTMEIMKLKWWSFLKVELLTSIDLHLYYHFFWFPSLLTATLETLITMNKEKKKECFVRMRMNQTWWHIPVILAPGKAEAGESPQVWGQPGLGWCFVLCLKQPWVSWSYSSSRDSLQNVMILLWQVFGDWLYIWLK